MAEFIKKWMIGIGCAWGLGVATYAYIKLGPLPNTDKYLLEKYERQTEKHKHLQYLDDHMEETLAKRNELRRKWASDSSSNNS